MNSITNNAYGKYFENQASSRGVEYRAALPEDIVIAPDSAVSKESKLFVEVSKFEKVKTGKDKVLDR